MNTPSALNRREFAKMVEVPHSPSLDDMKEGVTVSAWENRTADSTWNMIVSREIKDGPSEYFERKSLQYLAPNHNSTLTFASTT